MRLAYRYRLFTNANQERELAAALETHRRLYNVCLDYKKLAYQCFGASLNYCDFSRWFKGQRRTNPYFARLNFSAAQATMRRLDKSFANFFRRVAAGAAQPGYPRFKGRDWFDSIEYPAYRDGVRLTGHHLYVQHVGTIRVKMHRPVEGVIKNVRLKREAGKWFVIFSCELADAAVTPSVLPPVGIDVGLTHFLTTSEGTQEANPRYLRDTLPALRRANRSVSRKKKGGANRHKAVVRLQKVHALIANQRREHHYQVACRLVLAFGFIVVERLNISAMLKNDKLSRAIADVAWGSFAGILKHKAEKAGAQVVEVDPKGTSQQCSQCGQEVRKDLSVRWHDCPHCGLSLDRDHNAARNILARGLARTAPAGVNVGHKLKRPRRSRRLQATE